MPTHYLGSPRQRATVDQYQALNGPETGARVIRVSTPQGLDAHVYPDRALDLGRVTWGGKSLAWLSRAGFRPGAAVDQTDDRWLRTFGGGLLTTCGLDTVGDPSTDAAGRSWGLHGVIDSLAATVVAVRQHEDEIVIEGDVIQASVHGERLVLHRTLTFPLERAEIQVRDEVTNAGAFAQPHMILYHMNLGWPLIAPGTRLTTNGSAPEARNEEAERAPVPWDTFTAPTADAESLIYRHATPDPGVHARLESAEAGMAVEISSELATLPWLHQWKVMQPGQYVLGIEPSNVSTLEGRAPAEAAGLVPDLQPGETVTYDVRVAVFPWGPDE